MAIERDPIPVTTGIDYLDRLLGGMQRSDLLIIAGRCRLRVLGGFVGTLFRTFRVHLVLQLIR
mgnify:CR=1 FL=1